MNNAPKSPIKSDKSVFIGGMSKALMQATSHEEENLNQPIKLDTSSSMFKKQNASRVNVINFNINRTKPLMNVTNTEN